MKKQRQAFAAQHEDFRVDVPVGQSGLYEVRRYTMTDHDMMVALAVEITLGTDRDIKPGTYTQLLRYGHNGDPHRATVVMSDHLCEIADHEPLVTYARQHAPLRQVLVNGLGLGVVVELLESYVDHMTFIEQSADVIRLVAPHYQDRYGDRVQVVQADALAYQPPKGIYYDAVFHDIWDFISYENLPAMRHLHRKYGRRCNWQGSWARKYCERDARKRRANPEAYQNTVSMDEVLGSLYKLFAVTGNADLQEA